MNTKQSQQEYYRKHKEERKISDAAYYQANKQEILAKQKIYKRLHTLHYYSNGRQYTIYGLNKASYPHDARCPCCRRNIRLAYHHWKDDNYEDGIWLCVVCHRTLHKFLHNMPRARQILRQSFLSITLFKMALKSI